MFHVVNFIKRNEFGVVPESWLFGKTMCCYPSDEDPNDIETLVQQNTLPASGWGLCEVNMLGAFDTYEEARSTLIKEEVTPTAHAGQARPDREKRVPKRYQLDSEESGEFLLLQMTPPSKVAKTTHIALPPKRPSVHRTPPQIMQVAHLQRTQNAHIVNLKEKRSPHTTPPQKTQEFITPDTPLQQFTFTPQTHPHQATQTEPLSSNCCTCCPLKMQVLQELQKEVAEQTRLLEKHSHILSTVQLPIMKNFQMTSLPEDFPTQLPVNHIAHLVDVEAYLLIEENFAKVCAFFSLLTGRDWKNSVKRQLNTLIGHGLALACNWKGRYGKIAFEKFETIIYLIFRSTTANFEEKVTLSDVENYIKNYLRFASDRFGGRDARRSHPIPQLSIAL